MNVLCACGREIGPRVFRQHARKCITMLARWSKEGRQMSVLDERTKLPQGCTCRQKDAEFPCQACRETLTNP